MNTKVYQGKDGLFVLEMPPKDKKEILRQMAYRGLVYSTAASNKERAVLFTNNPYGVCDLGDGSEPLLVGFRRRIEASRALDGIGTKRLPPGKELWPYQRGTLDYLIANGGGIDADQPGLGKTPTSIAFCNHFEATRVLVIVPASVRLQWGERIREWSTIPNVKASVMLKVKDGIHPTAHYQVISYEAARNPAIIKAIAKYPWDVLICDEAHKMKNADAIVTRAILGNSRKEFQHGEDKIPCIATYCKRQVALTGTPLLNRPSECYVLFRHFDWEAIDYATEDQFKEKYNKQGEGETIEGKRFKMESTSLESELQNRLRVHIMARHLKADVMTQMDLPRFQLVTVAETGAIASAIEAEGMLGLTIEEVQTKKDIVTLGHIAEARRLMGQAMAPQIIDYVADLLEGGEQKYVLFGWHLNVLNLYEAGLARFGTVMLHGGKNAMQRQAAVDKFVRDDNVRVFIANLQAGGEGIDGLQHVASRCGLGEPDWVPSKNEQGVARLDRIGQRNGVMADIFVAPGSISEKIFVKSLQKLNTIHKVLDEKEIRK